MNDAQITGILSNWDRIEADIRIGLHEDFGKSKNVQDLLDIIKDLQVTANTVSPLRRMFNDHITDTKNPHEVSINLSELDLISTLYDLYNEKFGISMTIGEFGYSLVNIKRFATREDIDLNIHKDSVVNADILNYVIEAHDADPDAHTDLFRYKLPGLPITTPPTDVFEPSLTVSGIFLVDRPCPINYHDINGRVRTAPVNILPIDFAYGVPSCPIFGPHRNQLKNSRMLTDVNIHGASSNSNGDLFIISPIDDMEYLLLQEDGTFGTHGFRDPIHEELTGVKNYSIYIYPLERSKIVVSLKNAAANTIDYATFDCYSVESSPGSTTILHTEIQDLASGWYRCIVAFDATAKHIVSIDVDFVDEIAQDLVIPEFQGTIKNSMVFWQHQLTDTELPTPPIFTDDAPKSVLGTKVTRNLTGIFNPIRGSLVIRYLSPMTELFKTTKSILRIGSEDGSSNVVQIGTNEFNPNYNRIIDYNITGDVLNLFDSAPYDPAAPAFAKRVAFTYTLGFQGYGFTDQSPNVERTTLDDVVDQMATFFGSIYDGSEHTVGVRILQVKADDIGEAETDDTLIGGVLANMSRYRINMAAEVLELGYDSTTGKYLDGYLLNFRYYSVFSSMMNIEFLLDQYVPK